jgi:hypothetical protein
MRPPDHAVTFETPIAILWFEPSGMLCSHAKKSVPVTREYLETEFREIKARSGGKKVCWLGDVTEASAATKEARDFAAQETPHFVMALALLSSSAMTRMMANIFMTLKKPPYPTRMFNEEAEAREWLNQYL